MAPVPLDFQDRLIWLEPQTRLCELAAQARYLRSRNRRVVFKPSTDARRRRHVVKIFKLFKTFKTPDSINLIRHCQHRCFHRSGV